MYRKRKCSKKEEKGKEGVGVRERKIAGRKWGGGVREGGRGEWENKKKEKYDLKRHHQATEKDE